MNVDRLTEHLANAEFYIGTLRIAKMTPTERAIEGALTHILAVQTALVAELGVAQIVPTLAESLAKIARFVESLPNDKQL